MRKKREKGITLIVLIITIIVLLILAGVTYNFGLQGVEEANDNKLMSEIGIINHALLERKTKVDLTGESYPGTNITLTEVDNVIAQMNSKTSSSEQTITRKDTTGRQNYYKVKKGNGLEALGIDNSESEYIVNYETGEVINCTDMVTSEGKAVYIYSVENTNT